MSASAVIRAAPAEPARPWPRHVLTAGAWREMAGQLDAEPTLSLSAIWAELGQVHALFLDGATPLLATVPVIEGYYPALSPHRPAAALFERMVADLWGHAADGGDIRVWLDHGRWPTVHPMALRPAIAGGAPDAPEFLPVAGDGVHQIPQGPIRAEIGEPGHFRFHAVGEAVLRMEARLGYAHKGTLAMMRGKTPRAAARFAARLSGDATAAHGMAFAEAVEAALCVEPPPRAKALRRVILEWERMANHLGDIGAVCGEAGLADGAMRFGLGRERLTRAADAAFGHRLMMDAVVPGGAAADFGGPSPLLAALDALALPDLARLIERSASLASRTVGAGTVTAEQAGRYGVDGVIGRAASRGGDVDARLRVRLAELQSSAELVRASLGALPDGACTVALPQANGEGLGRADSFRGDIWHWVRLDGGMVASNFAADPSWRQWPLLEIATLGGPLADFPMVSRSFNCAISAVDL